MSREGRQNQRYFNVSSPSSCRDNKPYKMLIHYLRTTQSKKLHHSSIIHRKQSSQTYSKTIFRDMVSIIVTKGTASKWFNAIMVMLSAAKNLTFT